MHNKGKQLKGDSAGSRRFNEAINTYIRPGVFAKTPGYDGMSYS